MKASQIPLYYSKILELTVNPENCPATITSVQSYTFEIHCRIISLTSINRYRLLIILKPKINPIRRPPKNDFRSTTLYNICCKIYSQPPTGIRPTESGRHSYKYICHSREPIQSLATVRINELYAFHHLLNMLSTPFPALFATHGTSLRISICIGWNVH